MSDQPGDVYSGGVRVHFYRTVRVTSRRCWPTAGTMDVFRTPTARVLVDIDVVAKAVKPWSAWCVILIFGRDLAAVVTQLELGAVALRVVI